MNLLIDREEVKKQKYKEAGNCEKSLMFGA